ncbi:hypothetical protein [Tardiphaga sp. OK245]|uniref:hypothetical protein n=1 Tax=Tardiphaga sp. OK245 TaxID=1855306 RepID=UPI0011147CFF|nr:hypothetical protein [Tardiphaga sp. OK245]
MDKVFTGLVPLFGTWAGTILAFYFARENFASANQSVRELVTRLTPDQQLDQLSVRQAMKPRNRIEVLNATAPETDLNAQQLKDLFDKGITRIPIFADQKIAFVVHESTFNKYLVSRQATTARLDLKEVKLADFLAHKLGNEEIRKTASQFAMTKLDASLADARDAMMKVNGAQDVFVTDSGLPTESVVGWLTNSDFTRELR